MPNVDIVAPPNVYVTWGCRRCGLKGGVARTTFPIDTRWDEEMGRQLFAELRQKLTRVHQKQGCFAVPDDFTFRGIQAPPPGKHIIGKV